MDMNKTERYMIIFNDIGLTIKGYYNEPIAIIQRKKILDRLYSLIHRELFEGVQPLEEQTTTVSNGGVTALPLSDTANFPPEPKVKREIKHTAKYLRKMKRLNKQKAVQEPVEPLPEPEPVSTPEPEVLKAKDTFDNEKEDNQYNEFKKKGLI